jgi:hypothetical protein
MRWLQVNAERRNGHRPQFANSRRFPIPDNVDDDIAAAVVNPGLSAWGALAWRAQLTAGETVLIPGATGVTGKLAIQTAKLLGAGRVVAAGRNEQVLNTLHDLGADTIIRLDKHGQDLTEAFSREVGDTGFDVIIRWLVPFCVVRGWRFSEPELGNGSSTAGEWSSFPRVVCLQPTTRLCAERDFLVHRCAPDLTIVGRRSATVRKR